MTIKDNNMVTLVGRGGHSRKVMRRRVEHLIRNELANWSNSDRSLAHTDRDLTIQEAFRLAGACR